MKSNDTSAFTSLKPEEKQNLFYKTKASTFCSPDSSKEMVSPMSLGFDSSFDISKELVWYRRAILSPPSEQAPKSLDTHQRFGDAYLNETKSPQWLTNLTSGFKGIFSNFSTWSSVHKADRSSNRLVQSHPLIINKPGNDLNVLSLSSRRSPETAYPKALAQNSCEPVRHSCSSDALTGCVLMPNSNEGIYKNHSDFELDSVLKENFVRKRLLFAQCFKCLNQIAARLVEVYDLPTEWTDILLKIIKYIINQIHLNQHQMDEIDILRYVKIKAIPGGSLTDCFCVNGLVFTKDRIQKSMRDFVRNPKLLILNCSLRLESEDSLTSLELFLQKKKERLRSVCSKLLRLKPDVILLQKNVAGLIRDFVMKENICLLANVKPEVLRTLALITGARTVKAIDDMDYSDMGRCKLFHLNTYSGAFGQKICATFEGGLSKLYTTVILRGAPSFVLSRVRRALQYLIYSAYNMFLESNLLFEHAATVDRLSVSRFSTDQDQGRVSGTSGHPLQSASVFSDLEQVFRQVESPEEPSDSRKSNQLCSSWSVSLHEPETDSPKEVSTRCYLTISRPPIKPEVLRSFEVLRGANSYESMNDALPAVKFDYDFLLAQNRPCDLCTEPCLPETKSIRVPASELPFIDFLTYLKNKRPNVAKFAPQHLTYLYSLYNQSSNTQCVQHEFQVIHYYTSNDMTLGNFLLDVCFSARIRCSRETCHRAIEDHEQCFMHNRDRVNVVVRASDASDIELISNATAVHPLSSKSQARIHTWSKCKRSVVQGEPTAVLMSRESSSFSFGKFLELLFYCSNAYCLRCGQHVYKDHVHYFSYADRVAAFEHESVDIFEVVVPPILLKYDLEPLREVAHRDLLEIFDLSENIHVHILQKLEGLRDICRNAGGEEEQQKITATIQERVEAYADTRQRLRAAMLDGRNTRLFETSKIRRSVCLDSVNWNDVILKLEAEVQKILNFSKGSKLNASSALPSGEAALSKGRKGSGEKAENFTDALEQRSDSQVIDSLTNGGSCGGGEPKRRVSVSGGAEATEVSSGDNTEELKGMEVEGTGEGWQSEKAASFDSYLTERCRKSGCQLRGSKEDTSQGDVLNSDGPPVSLSHPFAPLSEVSSNLAHGLNLNMTTPDSSCKNGASGFTTVPLQKAMQRFLELKKSSILELVKGGPALILSSNVNSEYCVPIYEGEPSSLIAFFLTSEQYDLKTKEFLAAPRDVSFHRYHCEHSFRGNGDLDQLEDTVGDSEAALAALDESDSLYSRIIYGLVSPNPTTVNLEWQSPQIWGGPEVYIQCKAYFAQQFSWLRWLLGIPHDIFAQSLLRCRPWKPIGGKSNSEFIKTMDGRFILKQVQSVELESFLASALIYFDYFLKAVLQQIPTALCKVVGVYSVAWSTREGKALKKADFIMQEDLFFGHSVEKVFDLKGSQRSRYAKIGNDSKATKCVLLDENFLEAMYKQPICIGSKGKTLLSKAIWNDSQRLSSLNVMDYSLLVGFDNTNKKLILGIIDYMRTYTWDKQLETWVKRSGILGGSGSKVPTIISPKEYKKRFQDAIWTYFLFMPTSSTKLVYKKFL